NLGARSSSLSCPGLSMCWAGIRTGWRRAPAWVADLRPPLPVLRASLRSITSCSARWRRAVRPAAAAPVPASGRSPAAPRAVLADGVAGFLPDVFPDVLVDVLRAVGAAVGVVVRGVLLRAIVEVLRAQPALRARVPDRLAFFAAPFFAALRGAAFFAVVFAAFFVAVFFVAVFFAGVRVLSFRLFCSSETKSTTLVA